MRVISQDGTIDIPYELSAVTIGHKVDFSKFDINIRSKLLDERQCIVAIYSTEEKAKKAMEMLRDTYQYGKRVAVPKFDESGIDKEDDITLYNTRLINDFFKGGTCVPTKVFQFPKDEDVEE